MLAVLMRIDELTRQRHLQSSDIRAFENHKMCITLHAAAACYWILCTSCFKELRALGKEFGVRARRDFGKLLIRTLKFISSSVSMECFAVHSSAENINGFQ